LKTYSFIGSDKNAGKTTAFNYIYRQVYKTRQAGALCLSSIGINGEDVDTWNGAKKPHIDLQPNSYFITHAVHLASHTGKYETLLTLGRPLFSKNYIFGRSLLEMQLILEGPNKGKEISSAKHQIEPLLGDHAIFLIDGSINRQFLAKPEISDGFYFSLLFTKQPQQLQKSCDILQMLSLAPCCTQLHKTITENLTANTKSLLLADSDQVIYRGETLVSQDEDLKSKCDAISHAPGVLYLKGALTRSLYKFLAPFESLQLILDNFTLFLSITASKQQKPEFKPKIFLYHPVPVRNVFIKQETHFDPSLLPPGLIAKNIFREIDNEG
jgi:hypothetical protein